MDNSILFEDGPRLVRCDGCGGYFEPTDLKECRACGNKYCPECRKTHDCREPMKKPVETPQPVPSAVMITDADCFGDSDDNLAYYEMRCDGCGRVFNKSDLKKCRNCGAVLCSSCRGTHKCSDRKFQPAKASGVVVCDNTADETSSSESHAGSAEHDAQQAPSWSQNDGEPKKETGTRLPVRSDGVVVTGEKSVGLAVFLGILLVGAGLMYAGKVGKGFLFLILSLVLCWTFITPIVLWIVGIVKGAKLCKENNILWLEYIRG